MISYQKVAQHQNLHENPAYWKVHRELINAEIFVNWIQLNAVTIIIQSFQSKIKMTSRQKNRKKLNSQSIEIQINPQKHDKRENIGVIVGTKYKGLDINKNEQKQIKRSVNMIKGDLDKFEDVLSSEPKSKLSKYEEGRQSAVKVYERQDKHNVIDRLTFGPRSFRNKDNMSGSKIQKQSNPEQILPITHKKITKSRSSTKPSVLQEPKINSKVYEIMSKELGMSNSAILKLKQETLNYELQKFVKKKGKQYLQENHEKSKRRKTEQPIKQYGDLEIVLIDSENKKRKEKQKSRQKLDKYPNYIPEVFPKIVRKSSEKKAILSEAGKSDKLKSVQKLKIKSKKELKIENLNDQQEMLGKIVYDKVQDYFKLNQQKANYFSRVKSEQKIDEAWIQYLKTKVDRADLILKQKS